MRCKWDESLPLAMYWFPKRLERGKSCLFNNMENSSQSVHHIQILTNDDYLLVIISFYNRHFPPNNSQLFRKVKKETFHKTFSEGNAADFCMQQLSSLTQTFGWFGWLSQTFFYSPLQEQIKLQIWKAYPFSNHHNNLVINWLEICWRKKFRFKFQVEILPRLVNGHNFTRNKKTQQISLMSQVLFYDSSTMNIY